MGSCLSYSSSIVSLSTEYYRRWHCSIVAGGAMSEIFDVYLQSATIVPADGDNSCLYHSLSFSLDHAHLFSNVYVGTNNGFRLRHLVIDYIRNNLSKVVWIAPEISSTFAEAIIGDGSIINDYFARMSLNSSWGGVIEICAVAEMFHVNIQIFEKTSDPKLNFKWIGTFKYTLHNARVSPKSVIRSGLKKNFIPH